MSEPIKDTPDTLSAAVKAQRERMRLPQTPAGGTFAMRAAGVDYLPQFEAESDAAYRVRLGRSFLFNAFNATVRFLSGRVFAKPVSLRDDMPEAMRTLAEDLDLLGNNATVFARQWFDLAFRDGLAHVLVTAPRMPQGATLADAERIGARPWAVLVPHNEILGFRVQRGVGGVERVTHLRRHTTEIRPDGEFGEVEIEKVRVYEGNTWRDWERAPGADWIAVDGGKLAFGIQLVTLYLGERLGPLEATPPLNDLATLNLEHWGSAADQRHCLTTARCPILFAKGFDEDDVAAGLRVSPNTVVATGSVSADLRFVEHSGAALAAGREDLASVEEKMASYGAAFLMRRPGNPTATARSLDSAESSSPLATMAQNLEDALERVFAAFSPWLDGKPAAGSVSVFKDFALTDRAESEIDSLLALRRQGDISRNALLAELRRRGVLPDDFDIAADADAISTELPGDLEAA